MKLWHHSKPVPHLTLAAIIAKVRGFPEQRIKALASYRQKHLSKMSLKKGGYGGTSL